MHFLRNVLIFRVSRLARHVLAVVGMEKLVGVIVAHVVAMGTAAGAPAWCKNASASEPDVRDLSSKDVREVLRGFVAAECAPTEEIEAHRAEIEKARLAWSQRLALQESDWADVAAYVKSGYYNDDVTIRSDASTQDLGAATPLDQYITIRHAVANPSSVVDALYLADAYDARLSEAGRLAFLEECLRSDSQPGVMWAVCQEDFDHFDGAKLIEQLRGETAHPGELRMKVRLGAWRLPDRIKEHRDAVAKLQREDAAWKKLFDVAAKARAEWTAGVSKETKLLALVTRLDSAMLAQSRSMFANCDADTAAALAEAAAKIPAKTFVNMKDIRDDPFHGFANQALPLLVRDPKFHLAAIAVALCQARATAGVLAGALVNGPGARGPRDFALGRVATSDVQLDKVGATIVVPAKRRPYGSVHGVRAISSGGVVDRVTKQGDTLLVKLQPLVVKRDTCVAEHKTNRVERVQPDGRVTYELQCDQTAIVAKDEQWPPFKVAARYETSLKRGVVISVTDNGDVNDLIAVWPSDKAPLPTWIFGGTVR